MKAASKSPSYLVRNRYSYCFRIIVPADLQKIVGRKELRYTLKTGYLQAAKQKSHFISGQVLMLFRFLRKGGFAVAKLSDTQVLELVRKYIKSAIESWDRIFFEEPEEAPPGSTAYEAFDFLDDVRDQLIDRMNRGDFSLLEQPVSELLKKSGLRGIKKDSLSFLS